GGFRLPLLESARAFDSELLALAGQLRVGHGDLLLERGAPLVQGPALGLVVVGPFDHLPAPPVELGGQLPLPLPPGPPPVPTLRRVPQPRARPTVVSRMPGGRRATASRPVCTARSPGAGQRWRWVAGRPFASIPFPLRLARAGADGGLIGRQRGNG